MQRNAALLPIAPPSMFAVVPFQVAICSAQYHTHAFLAAPNETVE
jgi:hypothetical protein